MNCQTFREQTIDNSRDRRTLQQLAATEKHTADCAPCATWFAEQAALTQGLRALAENDRKTLAPSPHVEANLLAALRQQQTAQLSARLSAANETAKARPFVPFMQRTVSFSPRQFALAACLLVAVMSFIGWHAVTPGIAGQPAQNFSFAANNMGEFPAPAENMFMTTASEATDNPIINSPPVAELTPARPSSARQFIAVSQSKAANNPRTSVNPRRKPPQAAANGGNESLASHEIKTAFFPVNGAEILPPTDEWQIIRVRLPRAALANYGLALNPVTPNERVTADVMIGADGMARAIRFIR